MKIFVVSDIHSYYDAMMDALITNGFNINDKSHKVVICGDLFDRGKQAVKCFEFATQMAAEGRLYYILGNHEELLFDCINDIQCRNVREHHISNGTIDTIMQFTGLNYYDLLGGWCLDEMEVKMKPVLDFIINNTVDYAIFDDYIFVHGWVPSDPKTRKVSDNWMDEDANWTAARWENGMLAWHRGARIPGKTIICGHWHCSWGHSHLRLDRKEFPAKNRTDWQKSFEPFIDDGIVAIDACTAYSGFVNCYVIDAD